MPEIDKNIWLAFTIFFWRFLRVCDAVWRFVITRAAAVCVRHMAGVCNQISVLFQWGLRWELISHYTFILRSIPTAGNTHTHTRSASELFSVHLSVSNWTMMCVSVCVTDQRSPAPLKQDLHDHGLDSCEERRLERRREARLEKAWRDETNCDKTSRDKQQDQKRTENKRI